MIVVRLLVDMKLVDFRLPARYLSDIRPLTIHQTFHGSPATNGALKSREERAVRYWSRYLQNGATTVSA